MTKLSPAELRIIRSMVSREFGRASPLLDQLGSLEFDVRHMTGTGYYVRFQNADQFLRIEGLNTELTEDLPTLLAEPADLVAFTLFIRNGCLSSFEGYTFGDVKWPDEPMEKWLLLDAPGGGAPLVRRMG